MHIFDDLKTAEKFLKKTILAKNNDVITNRSWCIIPAGGYGKRFKSKTPKQYTSLNGKTVLEHCVESLLQFPQRALVSCLLIIISKEDQFCQSLDFNESKDDSYRHIPVVALRLGGKTRGESVSAGISFLKNIANSSDWIIIHDAARPYVSNEA